MSLDNIALSAKNAAHEFKSLDACPFKNKKSLCYLTWARSWYRQLSSAVKFAKEFEIESLLAQSNQALASSFASKEDEHKFLAELIILADYAQNDALSFS